MPMVCSTSSLLLSHCSSRFCHWAPLLVSSLDAARLPRCRCLNSSRMCVYNVCCVGWTWLCCAVLARALTDVRCAVCVRLCDPSFCGASSPFSATTTPTTRKTTCVRANDACCERVSIDASWQPCTCLCEFSSSRCCRATRSLTNSVISATISRPRPCCASDVTRRRGAYFERPIVGLYVSGQFGRLAHEHHGALRNALKFFDFVVAKVRQHLLPKG